MEKFLQTITFNIVLLALNNLHYCSGAETLPKIYNNEEVRIGYTTESGDDCYLFWSNIDNVDSAKNAEFRCDWKTANGDPMLIRKVSTNPDLFTISSNNDNNGNGDLNLVVNDPSSNKTNAEFRSDKVGSKLWIRKQENSLYAIGVGNCPLYLGDVLYWQGNYHQRRDAEFRCFRNVSNTFWIRHNRCTADKVEVLSNRTTHERLVVDVVAGETCGHAKTNLKFNQHKMMKEKFQITLPQQHIKWGDRINLELSTKLSGTKEETVSLRFGDSQMGLSGYQATRPIAFSSSSSLEYTGPGAAMMIAYVNVNNLIESNVPVLVSVNCYNNRKFTYKTKADVRITTFSDEYYRHHTRDFTECRDEHLECFQKPAITFEQRISAFKKCFLGENKSFSNNRVQNTA